MGPTHQLTVTTDVTLKTLDEELLPQAQALDGRYTVDMSSLRFISAASAVNLLLFLQYLRQISGEPPRLIPPESPDVASLLGNIHFFVFAENTCDIDKGYWLSKGLKFPALSHADLRQRRIFQITRIQDCSEPGASYERLGVSTDSLMHKLTIMGGGRFGELGVVYTELCKNIFEHSHSHGYVAALVLPSKVQYPCTFRITVGDLGVGIFESLSAMREHDPKQFNLRFGPIWDEPKAIDIAFAAGTTSKAQKQGALGGSGLPTVLEIARQARGTVVCRSGENKVYLGYRQNRWTPERKGDLLLFPGTQLEVSIPLDREFEKWWNS